MDSTTNAIVIVDARGRFTLVNRRFCEMTGRAEQQLLGAAFAEVVPAEVVARVGPVVRGILADGIPVEQVASELSRPDGSTIRVRFNAAPIWRGGAVVGIAATVEDISDRLRAEQALRESEARLRTFVSNAPLVLFGTDRDGVFTIFDGKGTEALGRERGQYVGQSIFEALAAFPEIVAYARRVLAGETVTFVFRGKRNAIEVHHAPVLDEAGVITGTIGVVINVSDRSQAQEALRTSEERYRAIFETHRVVRLLVDPATARVVEANQAACDFYGYTAEELAGKPVSEINTLTHEEILEKMRLARDMGETYFQVKHRLKSGEVRDVELHSGPVEVEGRTLLYSLIHDVTEERRVESLVNAQRQLMEMVAVGVPVKDVLERLTEVVEERSEGAICSILLLSPDRATLHHAAAPSLPAAYTDAIDGVAIGPEVGSCGTAAFLKREIVVEDIASDPLWADFSALALAHGLASCWSSPIVSSGGDVLGTFAVYHRETGGVRPHERSLIEIVTHVAGIAIERERAEAAMRSRTDELERSQQRLEEKSFLLERALEAERERSRCDQLTATLNHGAITDVMREMIQGGAQLAVAMVDVDGLKAANDTYGHQMGDAVLVLVAQMLQRDGAIVGRYGGDEFVAIIPDADRHAAEQYREGVLASLVGAGLTDEQTGMSIPVVASIGLAVYPEEAEAVDDLIRLSDSAMYASRRQHAAGGGEAQSRSMGSERAARMIGELVPLLTSPGAVDDKLRLVAHQLSVGAGYDGVNFFVEGMTRSRQASTTTDENPDEVEAFHQRQQRTDKRRITALLMQTMKPVIIDDIATTELLPPVQRKALVAGGLRSLLVAPMSWQGLLIGGLSVASKHQNAFTVRDVEFLGAVATQVTAIVRMSSLLEDLQTSTAQLEQAHEGTVMMLASAAEAHDHTTGRHLQRVRQLTEAIAGELEYDEERASALGMAATLHDIGKIRVPDSVLGSSRALAEAEWMLMKQHTLWGSAFLSEQPGFELAASVARHHHERWDGGGYPDGLAGEEIPESAQITTVADSFDAMTSDRPYRRGRPIDEAVAEIASCSGTQFSPRVVDALVRLFERGALAFVHPDDVDERDLNAA